MLTTTSTWFCSNQCKQSYMMVGIENSSFLLLYHLQVKKMLTDVCYETLSAHFCRKKVFSHYNGKLFRITAKFSQISAKLPFEKKKKKKKMRTKQNKKQNKIKTKNPGKLSCILQE